MHILVEETCLINLFFVSVFGSIGYPLANVEYELYSIQSRMTVTYANDDFFLLKARTKIAASATSCQVE